MTIDDKPMFFSTMDCPDATAALHMYRWRSGFYDWQLAPYEPIREHAIARLELQPGDTVLDIGCGTGMSLARLSEAVGPTGRVVAVDQCPEMIDMARQRVDQHGWTNVELCCTATQDAPLPVQADAALFHFTHDILQTPQALRRVLSHLKTGASVAATGLKWTSPLYGALNTLVWWNALQSVTTLKGLDEPWALLAAQGVDLRVETMVMDTIFVASGVLGRQVDDVER
jgi:precorrin-6B methylase 2